MEAWTFLTNHGHVLLCIAADPDLRLRDIAGRVGITERSAQRIVADLTAEGYLEHVKVGRRNRYRVRADLPMRHPVERESEVGALIQLVAGIGSRSKAAPRQANRSRPARTGR